MFSLIVTKCSSQAHIQAAIFNGEHKAENPLGYWNAVRVNGVFADFLEAAAHPTSARSNLEGINNIETQ